MDEGAFRPETMSSLECPGGALCWLITPEEPDEAQATGEALVSGCFHGLPRHLDHMACWREGRTVTSFYLGHSPKTGGIFPTPLSRWAPSQVAAVSSGLSMALGSLTCLHVP